MRIKSIQLSWFRGAADPVSLELVRHIALIREHLEIIEVAVIV